MTAIRFIGFVRSLPVASLDKDEVISKEERRRVSKVISLMKRIVVDLVHLMV